MLRPDFLNFEIIIIFPCVYTSGVTAVTLTNRPKSVRNRCINEVFGDVFYVVPLVYGFFCGCRGFGHRTESDPFLFSYYTYFAKNIKNMGRNKLKGKCSRTNLREAVSASEHLHVTSFLNFSNGNKNCVLEFIVRARGFVRFSFLDAISCFEYCRV